MTHLRSAEVAPTGVRGRGRGRAGRRGRAVGGRGRGSPVSCFNLSLRPDGHNLQDLIISDQGPYQQQYFDDNPPPVAQPGESVASFTGLFLNDMDDEYDAAADTTIRNVGSDLTFSLSSDSTDLTLGSHSGHLSTPLQHGQFTAGVLQNQHVFTAGDLTLGSHSGQLSIPLQYGQFTAGVLQNQQVFTAGDFTLGSYSGHSSIPFQHGRFTVGVPQNQQVFTAGDTTFQSGLPQLNFGGSVPVENEFRRRMSHNPIMVSFHLVLYHRITFVRSENLMTFSRNTSQGIEVACHRWISDPLYLHHSLVQSHQHRCEAVIAAPLRVDRVSRILAQITISVCLQEAFL